MDLNIGEEAAAMKRMTVNELRAKYADMFGEETPASNKGRLVNRIAWRLQALVISFGVIMGQELANRLAQRAFPEEDHPVQAFLLDVAHEPLDVGCEVRASRREKRGLHTLCLQDRPEGRREFAVAIHEHATLAELLLEHVDFRPLELDDPLLLPVDPGCQNHQKKLPGTQDETPESPMLKSRSKNSSIGWRPWAVNRPTWWSDARWQVPS
jgi:hypothetical protein